MRPCLEDNNTLPSPEDYKHVEKIFPHRWGITMVDDDIIVPKILRYAAPHALSFGHQGINKICNNATLFLWPNMRADIETKAKTCSACLNAGKNSKTQLPNMEKSKIEPPNHPREIIQINSPRNINSKLLPIYISCR